MLSSFMVEEDVKVSKWNRFDDVLTIARKIRRPRTTRFSFSAVDRKHKVGRIGD